MGAAARRNFYVRNMNSEQERMTIQDQTSELISTTNEKLFKMEVWERANWIAGLIRKADEQAKEIVQVIVRSGKWYPEVQQATLISRMNITLTGNEDQPHYQQSAIDETQKLRAARLARKGGK